MTLGATAGAADLAARFIESAPKDRFEFENISGCPVTAADLTLDLSTSAAGLIFDVTGSGAGVQVFQPFELVTGAENLLELPRIADGDSVLTLPISVLEPGGKIAFTIDVDDTLTQSESMVSDTEITGALVSLVLDGKHYSGVFTDQAQASISLPPCPTT